MYDDKKNKIPDSLIVIQNLKKERDNLMSTMPEDYRQFVRQHLKDNPKSFISIYMFHFYELIPTESDKEILRQMPEGYKSHFRFKDIMERK